MKFLSVFFLGFLFVAAYRLRPSSAIGNQKSTWIFGALELEVEIEKKISGNFFDVFRFKIYRFKFVESLQDDPSQNCAGSNSITPPPSGGSLKVHLYMTEAMSFELAP